MPLYMLLLFTFALQGLFSWNPWYRKQKSIQIELNRTKLSSIVSFMIRISKLLLQLSWISWRWGWGSGSWGLGRGILSCSLESCLACPLVPASKLCVYSNSRWWSLPVLLLGPAPAPMVTKYYSCTSQAGHSHYSTTWQIALQTCGQSDEIGQFKYEANEA